MPVCAQDGKNPSQTRPDLSGTWERNLAKSKSRGDVVGSSSVTLTISHKEPELRITARASFKGKETNLDSLYFTDGRGEKSKSRFQSFISLGLPGQIEGLQRIDSETPSKTKWEGNKLVTRSSINFLVQGNRIEIDLIEARELSSDGKTLTIATSFRSGGSTINEVFDRVQ